MTTFLAAVNTPVANGFQAPWFYSESDPVKPITQHQTCFVTLLVKFMRRLAFTGLTNHAHKRALDRGEFILRAVVSPAGFTVMRIYRKNF